MAGGEHLSLKLLQDHRGQHDVGSLSTEQSSRPALGIGSSKVWDQPLGKCRATVWKGGRNQSPNWNISKCSFVKDRPELLPIPFFRYRFFLFPEVQRTLVVCRGSLFPPFFETNPFLKEKREC